MTLRILYLHDDLAERYTVVPELDFPVFGPTIVVKPIPHGL